MDGVSIRAVTEMLMVMRCARKVSGKNDGYA